MVLTIDLGNSHVVAGVFKDHQLQGIWRLATDVTKKADEYGSLFSSHMAECGIKVNDISGCIMSSVVPRMTPILNRWWTPFIISLYRLFHGNFHLD